MVNVQYRDLGLDDRIAYINLQQAQRQGFRYRLEKSCLGKIISIFCFCCWIPRDPIERDWQKHRDYLFYNRRYDGEQGYDAWLNAVHKVNRNLPWKRLEIHNFVDQPRAHYVAPQRPVVVYQNPAPHRPPLILDNDPVFYPKKPFFQNPVRPVQGPELNVARAFNPAPNPAPLLPSALFTCSRKIKSIIDHTLLYLEMRFLFLIGVIIVQTTHDPVMLDPKFH